MSEDWVNPGNFVPHVVNPQANIIIRDKGQDSNTGELPKSLAHFYKGEPEALGAAQIFSGLVLFVCGIGLMVGTEMHLYHEGFIVLVSGLPIWSGVIYIICGSISVAAAVKPTMGKVRAILVMNIIGSLAAGSGMILLLIAVSLTYSPYRTIACIHQPNALCKGEFDVSSFLRGFYSIFLLFTSLMFCVSISNSVFGCKTACRTAFSEVNVVLYQTTAVNAPEAIEAAPLPSLDPITVPKSSKEPEDN